MKNVEMVRGTDKILSYEITYDGMPVDISGWTAWLTVRKDIPLTSVINDLDAIISKRIDVIDGTSGKVSFALTNEETDIDPRNYMYDVQMKSADNKINNTIVGKFTIYGDATRSR